MVILAQGNLFTLDVNRLNECWFGISSKASMRQDMGVTEQIIRTRMGHDGKIHFLDLVAIRREVGKDKKGTVGFSQLLELGSLITFAGGDVRNMYVDAERIIGILIGDNIQPSIVKKSIVTNVIMILYVLLLYIMVSLESIIMTIITICSPGSKISQLIRSILLYVPLSRRYHEIRYASLSSRAGHVYPLFPTDRVDLPDIEQVVDLVHEAGQLSVPNPYYNANLPMYARFFVKCRFGSLEEGTPGIWNVLYGMKTSDGAINTELFEKSTYFLKIGFSPNNRKVSLDTSLWREIFQRYHNTMLRKVTVDFPQSSTQEVFNITKMIVFWTFWQTSCEYIATFSGPFYSSVRYFLEKRASAKVKAWAQAKNNTKHIYKYKEPIVPEVSIWYWNHGWVPDQLCVNGNRVSYSDLLETITIPQYGDVGTYSNESNLTELKNSIIDDNMDYPAGKARTIQKWIKPVECLRFDLNRKWKIGTVNEICRTLGITTFQFDDWDKNISKKLMQLYAHPDDVEFPWGIMYAPPHNANMDLNWISGAFGLLTGTDDEDIIVQKTVNLHQFDQHVRNYIKNNVYGSLSDLMGRKGEHRSVFLLSESDIERPNRSIVWATSWFIKHWIHVSKVFPCAPVTAINTIQYFDQWWK